VRDGRSSETSETRKRDQRSEVGGQKTDDREQMTEIDLNPPASPEGEADGGQVA
jgi:hypothetical protein